MTDLEINKKFKDLYKDIKESKDILKDSYIIASNTDKGITSAVIKYRYFIKPYIGR